MFVLPKYGTTSLGDKCHILEVTYHKMPAHMYFFVCYSSVE